MTKRSPWRLLTAGLLGVALVIPLAGTAQAHPRAAHTIRLPDGFRPEGITIGPGKQAYLGSLADGDIYRTDLRTGKGRVISQGPGTPSVGLKIDRQGLLYVAGGPAGTGRIVSAKTGKILASYQFATAPTFVNDVVLTPTMAWFTDSLQAKIYGVPLARGGKPAASTQVVTRPLTGAWEQTAGVNNANGISLTRDRRSLLIVQSNTGFLFRVNPKTGRASRVDLGGTSLVNGDGLLRQGKIIYAVQNQLNQVAVLKLNRAGTKGRLLDVLTSKTFDVPTTIAASGKSLYLPNARFNTPPEADTQYRVSRIRRY